MGFNDFWINNNGKKEHLNNAKHGVRKEQVDKKFHNLFDAYDANGDGTLETEELDGVFKGLTKFAGADKTLDATENKQVANLFVNQAGIQDADFMGFVRSVSQAAEDIVDSKETPTADGGKEVTTRYKDGTVETISYYPDGEYKFKKLEQKGSTTTNYYTIGNNLDKHYTVDEIESRVKEAYDRRVAEIKQQAKQNSGIEGRGIIPIIPNYEEFKKGYLQHFNINLGRDTRNFERHDFELSERGKADIAVRDFVLNHYVETHKAAQAALESMGILDDVGAAINAGAGELWNTIKNVWKGTDEEYQNFYELSKKFEPNYNKALRESGSLDLMRNNPEMFFRDFETDFKKDMGRQYNLENSVQFQQSAEQYQNAQILKQRIDILNKAMQEIRMYQSEQDALVHSPAQNEGLNPASHIVSANKLLLQYFNNDQEAVDMILNGTIGNAEATIKAISGIKEDTEKLNKAVLDGKTFDQIQEDYKSQYKAMYGTDFVPEELTEKVMDAKATGGMVKLATITIVSILITKSPIMAEISAAAGGAEVSGAAANMIRTLVAKYGQTAVQQGIKLAMTSGTLATDVGLTLINQATSERGVNGEELWESAKGSAKYIFFGAYVGAPMAQAVSKSIGKLVGAEKMLEGGVKTANGAIQTTSISGNKLLQNLKNIAPTAGAFATDVAAFTGLEVATEGENLSDALSEQGQMLSKLKLMNHVLEYMLGAKAHTATSRANLDAAIEKSGVKNWNIKEIKTPQKTQYIVDIDGLPVGKFEDANQLATAMIERVSANYDETAVPELKTEIAKPRTEVKAPEVKPEGAEENPLLTRLETANDRESFVAIRDEIKKMPNGEQKTQMMQAYLKKYNEWSSNPSRPDIRMEYKSENESIAEQAVNTETASKLTNLLSSVNNIDETKIKDFISNIPNQQNAELLTKYLEKHIEDKNIRRLISMGGDKVAFDNLVSYLEKQGDKQINANEITAMECFSRDKFEYIQERGFEGLRRLDMSEIMSMNKLEPEQKETLFKLYVSKMFATAPYHRLFYLKDMNLDEAKLSRLDSLCDGIDERYMLDDSATNYVNLLELDNSKIDIIEKRNLLKKIPGREKKLSADDIEALITINDAQWQNVVDRGLLKDIEGRENLFDNNGLSGEGLIDLANLSDAEWNNVVKRNLLLLKNEDTRSYQDQYLKPGLIAELGKFTDEQYQEYEAYRNIEDPMGKKRFSVYSSIELTKVSPEVKQKVQEQNLLSLERNNRLLNSDEIIQLASIDNKQQARLDKFLEMKDSKNNARFSYEEALELLDMSDEQYETAMKRGLFNENTVTKDDYTFSDKFYPRDIIQLSSVSDKIWENIEKSGLKNKYMSYDVIKLSEMTEKQWERVLNDLLDKDKNPVRELDEVITISGFGDKEYNRFVQDILPNIEKYKDSNIYTIEFVTKMEDAKYQKLLNMVSDTDTDYLNSFSVDDLHGFVEKSNEVLLDRIKAFCQARKGMGESKLHELGVEENLMKLDDSQFQALLETMQKYPERCKNCSIGLISEAAKLGDELASFMDIPLRGEGKQLGISSAANIAKMPKEQRQRLLQLLSIEGRGEKQLDTGTAFNLAELPDDKYALVNEFVYNSKRKADNQLDDAVLEAIFEHPVEQINKIKDILFLDNSSNPDEYYQLDCNGYQIDELFKLEDKQVERIRKDLIPYGRTVGAGNAVFGLNLLGNMIDVAKLNDHQYKRLKDDILPEDSDYRKTHSYLSAYHMKSLCELTDEEYAKAKTDLFYIEGRDSYQQIEAYNYKKFLSLPEEQYNRCKNDLFFVPDRKQQLDEDNILEIAALPKEKYNFMKVGLKSEAGQHNSTIKDVLKRIKIDDIYNELNDLKTNGDFSLEDQFNIFAVMNSKNSDFVTELCKEYKNWGIPANCIYAIAKSVNKDNIEYAKQICKEFQKHEITPNQIPLLLNKENGLTYKQIQKLNRTLGRQKVASLSNSDLLIAGKFTDLYGKQNINEIPIKDKKNILRSLVSSNTGLFEISEDLSKDFPLIPKNQEEYCSLLPSIVRSLGIETNELTPEQRITMFNSSMGNLSQSLSKISDTDFANMKISQEYPKDKFILDVLDKVKALPSTERQKVYDYFGFELHHNKENLTGFSITGYPVNLNNGKKLAQIDDPRTKAVVEDLRPNVVRFSENNKIKCNNPEVEQFLNEVIEALPELRTTIGKKQHGTQAFDVMQHSLKVMQKITQDPKFATLNESDQKIMLLASLMHDITKAEGSVDKQHANYGSFDTYFIAQKFNLTKEEEIKLHTLIKKHEWLEHVNTAKSERELTRRLQSVAYDLHQGNLFDMAEIFTHADLKAVRVDDSFHDTTEGKSRIGFDGTARSFGESANVYAERIRGYIKELQKSQPLLPQTKIPRANKINEAITQVNPDGSTNIKGVYKDKDGLIVIKFNEVEDWEAIGFPKGSISHGIEIQKGEKGDAELSEDVNTGNIKFFVHGLDYSNQLAKFDAFSLVDSDALLSVSYAERPESKFRFFRPQGVLLDVNSKYIHGGGNTDAGSGCGKDIAEFKNNYIFGGHRESDRLYISDLIKKATGMTDEQYVDFVEQNKDRPIQEIEPVEIRDKIVKAFATINSNTRKGKREYNEMYISNPNEVMGVFAYSMDYNETIGNPINFLNRSSIGKYEKGYGTVGDISVRERTEFLRQYALERNLPFIIFGD